MNCICGEVRGRLASETSEASESVKNQIYLEVIRWFII